MIRAACNTFYPVIYGAEESDDWTDPKVWKKANPPLGTTVGIDKVKDACESAKQNPGEESSFRQLRLNQWVKQAVRWMPEDNLDFRVQRDHVPYAVWERQGYLQTTEGNVVHYGYIEKFIESLGEHFNIRGKCL